MCVSSSLIHTIKLYIYINIAQDMYIDKNIPYKPKAIYKGKHSRVANDTAKFHVT